MTKNERKMPDSWECCDGTNYSKHEKERIWLLQFLEYHFINRTPVSKAKQPTFCDNK